METEEKDGQIQSTRWTIPHTEITLVRIDEGPQQGAFHFSASMVASAKRFFEKVVDPETARNLLIALAVMAITAI